MSTINVTNLSGRGGATPNLPDGAIISGVTTATNVSVSGAVTATTFDGSLKSTGTPTLGLGVTINASGVAISGVATAGIGSFTTVYGDGSNLTGVAASIAPWNYNPDVSDTKATLATGIGITFNTAISSGSGTATLKIVNAGTAGTTIQSWGVGSCTFNANVLTFGALVSNLAINQTYQVDIPATFIDDSGGNSYVGTAYTFTAQDGDYSLWIWGDNTDGEIGVNNQGVDYSSPVQVPGTNWGPLWEGAGHNNTMSVVLKTDGTAWAWGNNARGQLGLNDGIRRSSPVQIGSESTWTSVSAGYESPVAIKNDGTLWVWGRGLEGQHGNNAAINNSSPVQIPGTTWRQSAGGYGVGAAIKTDGTLWTWGANWYGQLGYGGGPTKYSSPAQIPGTSWKHVVSGTYTMMATRTDGTLWSWGLNAKGELGHNSTTEYSSPVQVPGTTWSAIICNRAHSVATKTDGTLWTWGENNQGALGINLHTGNRSSPCQIPGTNWSTKQGGITVWQSPLAVKTDGTLWAWGQNESGPLGQNNQTQYSSPVQIGSETDWDSVTSFYQSAAALRKDTTP